MSKNALEICLKCHELIVDTSSRIECDNGLCGRVCHRKCTDLSEDQLKMLDTLPNLRWKCDTCVGKAQSVPKMSQWLEKCVREHEKRLEVLEQGLERRKRKYSEKNMN